MQQSQRPVGLGRTWAGQGHPEQLFDALGPERSVQITHVSANGADWIAAVIAEKCPNAVRCADPFHVVEWTTEGLDEVRRAALNDARKASRSNETRQKNSHYALWKDSENLTEKQKVKLARIVYTDPTRGRAYYLQEGLRTIFKLPHDQASEALDKWVAWARRCRTPAFLKLQRTIIKHRAAIPAAIEHGLANGRVESINTKIRFITRIALSFASPHVLTALAMHSLGGHKQLDAEGPGRN